MGLREGPKKVITYYCHGCKFSVKKHGVGSWACDEWLYRCSHPQEKSTKKWRSNMPNTPTWCPLKPE